MSTYERYDDTSRAYDSTRTAVGIEIILGYLASHPVPLRSQTILDAGCGTGNYAVKIAQQGCKVICADYSKGMLARCEEKMLVGNDLKYEILHGDISALDFGIDQFDAVVCNQSLHHLDQPGTGFTKLKTFLRHAFDSLKPNGMLIINTITHAQLKDGVWWGDLIAPAVEKMKSRFIERAELQAMFAEIGFALTDTVVPLDSIIQRSGYFDPGSLYSPSFRSGDSHFALLSTDELDSVFAQLNQMEQEGTLESYIRQRDQLRQSIGQYTYYVGRKSSSLTA